MYLYRYQPVDASEVVYDLRRNNGKVTRGQVFPLLSTIKDDGAVAFCGIHHGVLLAVMVDC